MHRPVKLHEFMLIHQSELLNYFFKVSQLQYQISAFYMYKVSPATPTPNAKTKMNCLENRSSRKH